jgi:uncharacterized repeat protein (TIGR03803 family)
MAQLNRRLKLMTVICLFVSAGVSLVASAQTETPLLGFDGTTAAGPQSPLTQGIDGRLYGMTYYGGTGSCFNGQGIGCGVIFKVNHDRVLTVLYNFQNANNFYYPEGELTLGTDGNLYGIAQNTIFKITPSGNLTTLHTFTGGPGGSGPTGGVVQGVDGNFYGTTGGGGTPSQFCPSGCGTVFKMTPGGTVTTLYSFCPQDYCPDGAEPLGALVQGPDGDFYGTTTNEGLYHDGTVFKISPSGVFSTIYTFEQASPDPGLLLATDGNFYGTQSFDVFRLTPDGIFTSLGSLGSGEFPNPLIQGTDGNIYGTTVRGGSSDDGVIFTLPLDGSPSILYSFAGYPNDGSNPFAGFVQVTNGTFYGTTFAGGNSGCNYYEAGCGTIFSLDMGLKPFVAFVNRASRIGKRVGILGQGFGGTSSVEFNGIPATFVVKSNTLLIATVPAGATTGYVTVTRPNGVLKSNVPFYVIP